MSYQYDILDRLVSAKMPSSGATLAEYSYDRNCNPTHISRYGVTEVVGKATEWGEIDNVNFSYLGNQRQSATDSRPALTYTGANDYPSGTSTYTWDDNGNLLSDSGSALPPSPTTASTNLRISILAPKEIYFSITMPWGVSSRCNQLPNLASIL